MAEQATATDTNIVAELQRALGQDAVDTSEHKRRVFSCDFSEIPGALANIIVTPTSPEDVSACLKIAAGAGYAVVPRGGGMSYTRGYVPVKPETILLDMTGMNRVLDINADDLTVTVEPGITWAELDQALADKPVSLALRGTFSGKQATVGGGLGNNALGIGRGSITDNIIGLEVVLPDGRILNTGGRATKGQGTTIRNFGPDLTELFVHDAGAMGVKTKVTFRLQPRPKGIAFAAFGFQDYDRALEAFMDAIRTQAASDIYIFGIFHHHQFADQPKPPADEVRQIVRSVMGFTDSRLRGARDVFRMVRTGGLNYLKKWTYSVQLSTEGQTRREADERMKALNKVFKQYGGKSIPAAFPIALRAQPFNPVERLIMGPEGQCSIPSNCAVPLSQGPEICRALDKFFADNAAIIEKHNIQLARNHLQISNCFGVEPIIYWTDSLSPLRQDILSEENRKKFGVHKTDEDARAAALDLRRRMVKEVFSRFNHAHYQVGKYYPYREALGSDTEWEMLKSIKTLLDPAGVLNPGALGL